MSSAYDWIRGAQEWLVKTQRSSGFYPLLFFVFLVLIGVAIVLSIAGATSYLSTIVVCVFVIVVLWFLVIYTIKAFQQPEFCRSETHLENMRRLEREPLGSKEEQIPAADEDRILIDESVPAPQLPSDPSEKHP
ncbi:MAG: hypothetical protein IT434_04555 [Phycisphaerales bacterium]|nr:hypothetical protein [Phycisphaerales bacterium]